MNYSDTDFSLELTAGDALGKAARVSEWEVLDVLGDQLGGEGDLLLRGDHATIVRLDGCGRAYVCGGLQ